MYYDYCMAAPYMAGLHTKGRPLDVLILGMGSGTFAGQCDRYFEGIQTEGVEIDRKITDLAYDLFELPDHIKVTTYDGRAYLEALSDDKVYDVIKDRKLHPKEGSYTNYLLDKGLDKILKKVGEEATETIIAAKNPSNHEVVYEISDLLYHLMVLMAEKDISWEEVTKELAGR